jgi:hypothetical protein
MLLLFACQPDPAREATGGASEGAGVHSNGDLPESVPGSTGDEPEPDDKSADGEVCQATLDCPDGLVEEIKTDCHLSIARQDGTVD